MNIKQQLLSAAALYDPKVPLDAPIRKKYVPALFFNTVLERGSWSAGLVGVIRRWTWIDNEDRRWKGIFCDAVKEMTEEEKGQFIGEKGAAFYRFRASLVEKECDQLQLPLHLSSGELKRSLDSERAEIQRLSLLGKGGKSPHSADALMEILGGEKRNFDLQGVMKIVLSHRKSAKWENALQLEGEAQQIISAKNREKLKAHSAKIAASLEGGVLLCGKLPKVRPDIKVNGIVSQEETIEKMIEKSSLELKKEFKENKSLLMILRQALNFRQSLLEEAVKKEMAIWWKEPQVFVYNRLKKMAVGYLLDVGTDCAKGLAGHLKPGLIEELQELLKEEQDEILVDKAVQRLESMGKGVVQRMQDPLYDVAMDLGEALPPFLTGMLDALGYGHFGRSEQPLWLEIERQANGKFRVSLHLTGRAVLDHQVEGKGYQSVFRYNDISPELLNTDFFYRFYTYQAYTEWQGDVYDTEDVIANLSLSFGKEPVPPEKAPDTVSATAHLAQGVWGALQEYELKGEKALCFTLKFEAYCALFQMFIDKEHPIGWMAMLEEKALALVEEMVTLQGIPESEIKLATLQDALIRLKGLKVKGAEVPKVLPLELQAIAHKLFSAIGMTPFRVSLIKDLLIDQLGEESRETVENLVQLFEEETHLVEDIPTPLLSWKSLELPHTAFGVASLAIRIFFGPMVYAANLAKSLAAKAFSYYFPETEKKLIRLKTRFIARAVLPLLLKEEQMKDFRLLLQKVEGQLLHNEKLSFRPAGAPTDRPIEKWKAHAKALTVQPQEIRQGAISFECQPESEPLTPQNVAARLKKWQADAALLPLVAKPLFWKEKLKLLPPAMRGKDFWSEVKDLEGCLEAVTNTCLLLNEMEQIRVEETEHQLIVHAFTLYAIADKLARRHPENGLHGFKVNPWGFINWYSRLSACVLDSGMQKRYETCCRYFAIDPHKSYSFEEIQQKQSECLFAHSAKEEKRDELEPSYFETTQDGLYFKELLKRKETGQKLKRIGVDQESSLMDQLTLLYVNPTQAVDREDQGKEFLAMMREFSELVPQGSQASDHVRQLLSEGQKYLEENKENLLEGFAKGNDSKYTGLLPLPDHALRQVHDITNRMLKGNRNRVQNIWTSPINFQGRHHVVHNTVNEISHFLIKRDILNPQIDSHSIFASLWGTTRVVSQKMFNAANEILEESDANNDRKQQKTNWRALPLKPQYAILNEGAELGHFSNPNLARMVFSDPLDRPARALSYFTENHRDLKTKSGMLFLELALLQGSALRKQLKDHPPFLKVLRQFFTSNLSYLVKEGEGEKALALFRIALLVQLEIDTMGGFTEPLISFDDTFQLLQSKAANNSDLYCLVGLRHALKNPQTGDKTVVRDLLKAHFRIDKSEWQREFDEVYLSWSGVIAKTLAEDPAFKEEMLADFCAVQKYNIEEGKELPWEGDYPCYTKGKFQINIACKSANMESELWEKALIEALTPFFPQWEKKKPIFVQKEEGLIEIPSLDIEVVTDPVHGGCRFYKKIGGKHFLWVDTAKSDSDTTTWLEEGGSNHVLIYRMGTLVGRYRAKVSEDVGAKSVELVAQLKSYQGAWLEEKNLAPFAAGLAPLTRFCPLKEMRGYAVKESQELKLIELPLMDLRFEIEEGKAYSKHGFGGYYLADKQKEKSLGSFANYLVLQNEAGEKKILLPKNSLTNAIGSRLLNIVGIYSSSQLLNSVNAAEDPLQQTGYFAFELDKTGKLASKDPAALTHLVACHMAKRDYAEAMRYFKELESVLYTGPMNGEVLKLMAYVLGIALLVQDSAAIDISLKLAALCQENRGLHPSTDQKVDRTLALISFIALQKNYLSYLDRKDNYPQLTPHQELFLAEALERSCGQLVAEFKYLTDNMMMKLDGVLTGCISVFLVHPRIAERSKALLKRHAPQLIHPYSAWKQMLQNLFSSSSGNENASSKMFELLDLVKCYRNMDFSKADLYASFKDCSLEKVPCDQLKTAYSELTPELITRHFLSYYALIRQEEKSPKLAEFTQSLKLMKGWRGKNRLLIDVLQIASENPSAFPTSANLQNELSPQKALPPPTTGWKRMGAPVLTAGQTKANEEFAKQRELWREKERQLSTLGADLERIQRKATTFLVSGTPFLTTLDNSLAEIYRLKEEASGKISEPLPFKTEGIWQFFTSGAPPPESAQRDLIYKLCSSNKTRKALFNPFTKLVKTMGPSLLKNAGLTLGASYLGLSRLPWLYTAGTVAFAYSQVDHEVPVYAPDKPLEDPPMPNWSRAMQQEDEDLGRRLKNLAETIFPFEFHSTPIPEPLEGSDPDTKRLNESLNAYAKREKPKSWAGKAAVDDLYRVRDEAAKAATDLATLLAEEKEALLTFVNQPHIEVHRVADALKTLKREDLDFDTLLECYLYNDTAQLQAKTNLNESQVEIVYQRLTRFLMWQTRQSQLQRAVSQIDEANKKDRKSIEYQLQVKTIAENLAAPRAYRIDGQSSRLTRAYLIFEARNGIMLWDKQVSQLEKMLLSLDRKAVVELIMGSGKTFFGIPVTDYFAGNGAQFVINIFTRALAKTGISDISAQAKTFYKKSYATQFSRSQPLSASEMRGRLLSMLSSIKGGGHFSACKEDLQALELIWLEDIYKHNSSENLTLMTEILRLIRYFGKPKFDEVHEILRRDSQLNHPLGAKEHLKTEYIRVTEEYVRQLLALDESIGLKANQQALMTEETYEQKVKQKVAEQMAASALVKDEGVVNYLTQSASTVTSSVSRSLLGLARGLINVIGPKSLNKIVNVHYGPSKVKASYAKPYRGNKTCVEEADIQSQYEACLKTFLQQMVNRMSDGQVDQLVERLNAQAKREARANGVDFNQTRTARLFAEWCKNKYQLNALKPQDMAAVKELLNAQDEAVLLHARLFIAPEITYYKNSLSSNSQNFASMFPGFYSGSGTPNNWETYPSGTKVFFDEGTMGESIDLLLSMCATEESILTIPGHTPEEALEEILKKSKPGETKALVDCGALLRGIDSSVVAEKAAAYLKVHDKSAETLVYYNEDQVLMEKDLKVDKQEPFKKVPKTQKGRFAYFDHTHTQGADIPLNEVAKAEVTIGEDTTLTQLAQAIWRLRGVKRAKQTFQLVLTEKTRKLIAGDGPCTIREIIKFTIRNEAKKRMEDNFIADKQKIADVIRRAVLDKLLAAGSHEEMFAIFSKYQKVIITESEDDPFILFGLPQKGMDPEKVLEKMKEEHKKLIAGDALFTEADRQDIQEKLDAIGKGNYPKEVQVSINGEKVQLSLHSELGQEQQVEQNQNQNQENQLQQNVENELNQVTHESPRKTPPDLLPPLPSDPDADYFSSLDWLIPSPFSDLSDKKRRCFNLASTLIYAEAPNLAKKASAFRGEILCTDNFIGRKKSAYFFETLCTPFTRKQNPPQEVLIIVDKGRYSILLIDQEEGHFWREQIPKGRDSTVEIALYDLALKSVVLHSKKGAVLPDLPGLKSDLTRLKFLKGSVNYDAEESQILRKWLKEEGVDQMKALFKEVHGLFGIAPLLGSPLEALFDELIE